MGGVKNALGFIVLTYYHQLWSNTQHHITKHK